jgi:hypothetical protein
MAATSKAATTAQASEEPVTTLPATDWFGPEPFAETLAATPDWPEVPSEEPAAIVDESTAPGRDPRAMPELPPVEQIEEPAPDATATAA